MVYPSNAIDAKGLLATALESEDPVIFFEPIVKYFTRYDDVPVEHYTIPIGKARIARAGTDVTVVTYGNTVGISEQAAEQLEDQGVSVEVIDLRSIKPWDEQCVLDSVEKTGRLVVVHEAAKSGGFGAEIIATVMEKGRLSARNATCARRPRRHALGRRKLEPYSMIQPERIAVAVRKVIED